jgi:hypothetical protein
VSFEIERSRNIYYLSTHQHLEVSSFSFYVDSSNSTAEPTVVLHLRCVQVLEACRTVQQLAGEAWTVSLNLSISCLKLSLFQCS